MHEHQQQSVLTFTMLLRGHGCHTDASQICRNGIVTWLATGRQMLGTSPAHLGTQDPTSSVISDGWLHGAGRLLHYVDGRPSTSFPCTSCSSLGPSSTLQSILQKDPYTLDPKPQTLFVYKGPYQPQTPEFISKERSESTPRAQIPAVWESIGV